MTRLHVRLDQAQRPDQRPGTRPETRPETRDQTRDQGPENRPETRPETRYQTRDQGPGPGQGYACGKDPSTGPTGSLEAGPTLTTPRTALRTHSPPPVLL
ncbi:unnamed protein product [Gadus morhua 'NCC']